LAFYPLYVCHTSGYFYKFINFNLYPFIDRKAAEKAGKARENGKASAGTDEASGFAGIKQRA